MNSGPKHGIKSQALDEDDRGDIDNNLDQNEEENGDCENLLQPQEKIGLKDFDLIKVIAKAGGAIEDSQFIEGIIVDKEFSHPQMLKEIKDAKVCILTCPFEPPKPKTKHGLEIKTAEEYNQLLAMEQNYFTDMVKKVKDSGANVVLCQWGFDDEANHLLM